MMAFSSKPTVSVIIPVHNGGSNFRRCLLSLAAAVPPPEEIMVVADGDSDGSWRMAEEFGLRVIRLPVSRGPAGARNAGAGAAKGEILFFVDADVTVPPDAIAQILSAFQQAPEMSVLFGSYDDEPFETNFLSQYKNLFHHYVHQTANAEASTFWGACGAVRRNVFLAAGGFNEEYRHPSIEDIELGYRLKKAGCRVRLVKGLMVKHLKRWDARSLLMADFFYRALPWTALILNQGEFVDDLNLKTSNRLGVVFTNILLLSLLGALCTPWLMIPAALYSMGLLRLNRDLYRFFEKRRGLLFTLKAIPWHWFYFFYCGLAFSLGLVSFRLKRLQP